MLAKSKGDLLDFGCGTVPYYLHYANYVKSVTLADIIETPSEAGNFIAADANSPLPFANERFDTILATEVFEHIKNPSLLIKEFFRILRPEGVVIISVPFIYPLHEIPNDFWRYTSFGLKQLVVEAGFEADAIYQVGTIISILVDYLDKLFSRVIFKRKKRVTSFISNLLFRLTKYNHRKLEIGKQQNSIKNSYALGYIILCRKPTNG